jgi:hypothetical protein
VVLHRSEAPVTPVEKKLTPMEKLKLKMRAGLEKSSNIKRISNDFTIVILRMIY